MYFVSLRKILSAVLQDKMCDCVCVCERVCVSAILDRERQSDGQFLAEIRFHAASSRDVRRIECFLLSNSITHSLLHPPPHFFPLSLLFVCSICFPASTCVSVSLSCTLAAGVSVRLLPFSFFLPIHHGLTLPPFSACDSVSSF